tara:strand:- start:70 stop:894 length:825 start_codon:yes stop_codon:yes gene_type:complete
MNFIFNTTVKDFTKFKNFIDSISAFPFTKLMFFVNNETSHNIHNFLNSVFEQHKLEYSEKLNCSQLDWQKLYDHIDSEFVWVCSRYDHYFVDNDLQHLNDVLQFRSDGGTEKLASICLSNWLKCLTKCVIIDHGIWDGNTHPAPTQAWMTVDECDSFQIATKALYHSWFFDQEFGKVKASSLEQLSYKLDFIRPWKVQVPSKEFLRDSKLLTSNYNFYNLQESIEIRKQKFDAYYFSTISPQQAYLANPNFDAGIYQRILRHYKFNTREETNEK